MNTDILIQTEVKLVMLITIKIMRIYIVDFSNAGNKFGLLDVKLQLFSTLVKRTVLESTNYARWKNEGQ